MSITQYNYIIYAALALVMLVLVAGILNLAFSGAKAASRSNKLMRMRVIFQAVAICLIMFGFWLKTHH